MIVEPYGTRFKQALGKVQKDQLGRIFLVHRDPNAKAPVQEFPSAHYAAAALVADPELWRYANPQEIEEWDLDQARRREYGETLLRTNGARQVDADPRAVAAALLGAK